MSFGASIDIVGRRAGSALHVVKDSADVSEPVEVRSAAFPTDCRYLRDFRTQMPPRSSFITLGAGVISVSHSSVHQTPLSCG